jgi:MerR family regulatory protein
MRETTRPKPLLIGALSSHSGVNVETIRHYERAGLLPVPPRDPPPLKWSDLRYVFGIKEDCNGKEAIQA